MGPAKISRKRINRLKNNKENHSGNIYRKEDGALTRNDDEVLEVLGYNKIYFY